MYVLYLGFLFPTEFYPTYIQAAYMVFRDQDLNSSFILPSAGSKEQALSQSQQR